MTDRNEMPQFGIERNPARNGSEVMIAIHIHGTSIIAGKIDYADEEARKTFGANAVTSAIDQGFIAAEDADTYREQLVAALRQDFTCMVAELATVAELKRKDLERKVAPRGENVDDPLGKEVPASQVVRPERMLFRISDTVVSGVTVPLLTEYVPPTVEEDAGESTEGRAGKAVMVRRWALYYIDGKTGERHMRNLPPVLEVAGEHVHVDPMPKPTKVRGLGWSKIGRDQWLKTGEDFLGPKETFEKLRAAFANHIVLPKEDRDATLDLLTVWTFMTYAATAFPAVPYLNLAGTKESGKSRVLDCLGQVIFRPHFLSSMTAPVLFRRLDALGGCLLLDEAENLGRSSEAGSELVPLLNAGYRRDGVACRCEGDNHDVKEYAVFAPKALAAIEALPEVLASRCIQILMRRASKRSPEIRRNPADPKYAVVWQDIRDALHVLALNHGEAWVDLHANQAVLPELSGRAGELWQPLLSIAAWLEDFMVDGVLGRLTKMAIAQSEASMESQLQEVDQILLEACWEMFAAGRTQVPMRDILQAARSKSERLFRDVSEKRAGNRLRYYGIDKTAKVKGLRLWALTEEVFKNADATHGTTFLKADADQPDADQPGVTPAAATPADLDDLDDLDCWSDPPA